VLSRDLRGYQELMFGACVRNAMFFATLPYYVARKMRHGRLGSQGSDILETGSALSGDTALGRKPNREAARPAPNPPTTQYVPKRLPTSQCASLTKGDL
jgi:hypothetical protein